MKAMQTNTNTNDLFTAMTTSQSEPVPTMGGVPVTTNVKAGSLTSNHNATAAAGRGLAVRTAVKAGAVAPDI